MKTENRTIEVVVQDNPNEAVAWLENEYPHGVELVYIDYRDELSPEQLQEVLKNGYMSDEDWIGDSQHESINQIITEYEKAHNIDELSDAASEAMRDWLYDHDNSNPTKDLLHNTSRELFYIETVDEYEKNPEAEAKTNENIVKKYAKTDEQKKEILQAFNESFYSAPVSFYFYANALEMYEVLHGKESDSEYVVVEGAYFSTIDRVQGSNWLGERAVFTIAIPRETFTKNVYMDKAEGTGYGWHKIAGPSGYDDATVYGMSAKELSKKKTPAIVIETSTSEAQKREQELAENWQKTGKCTLGDMNFTRHVGPQEYENSFPCGTHCRACGTFWVD